MNIAPQPLRVRLRLFMTAMIAAFSGAALCLLPIMPEVVGNALQQKDVSFVSAMFTAVSSKIDAFTELVLGGALIGVFAFVWRQFAQTPNNRALTRTDFANLIEQFHRPEYKTRLPASNLPPLPDGANISPVISFLAELGLITESDMGFVASSQLADALLCSLAAHLKGGRPNFLCEWSAEPRSPDAESALVLIRQVEANRIAGRPINDAVPARSVRSGLAVIRMDIGDIPHVLLVKSDQWNRAGGWWWPGGTEEVNDNGNLITTVSREVKEELGMAPSDDDAILEIRELFASHDVRISGSLGLLTKYEFRMFAVRLKDDHPKVQPLLGDNPSANIYYPHSVRTHHFKWVAISDLSNEPHLSENVPHLMSDFSNRVSIQNLPQTTSRPPSP